MIIFMVIGHRETFRVGGEQRFGLIEGLLMEILKNQTEL